MERAPEGQSRGAYDTRDRLPLAAGRARRLVHERAARPRRRGAEDDIAARGVAEVGRGAGRRGQECLGRHRVECLAAELPHEVDAGTRELEVHRA